MVVDREGFRTEALPFALGAFDIEVAEKLHFNLLIARALATPAATRPAIERKIARPHVLLGGVRSIGKDRSDVLIGPGVDRRGAARRPARGALVHHDYPANQFVPTNSPTAPRLVFTAQAFLAKQVFIKHLVHQGALAGTRNARNGTKHPQGQRDVKALQVVLARPRNHQSVPRSGPPPPRRNRDHLSSQQIVRREGAPRHRQIFMRTMENQLSSLLAAPRADLNEIVGRPHHALFVLHH